MGAACPNFGAVWTVPPNHQPEQRSCYFLYFRFLFIGGKGKGCKIHKWPKTDEKTRFGATLGFFLS